MEPIIRSACKECHGRKIRCLVPPHGGSCEACITFQRQCYFLPRQKAGRPRRGSRRLQSPLCTQQTTPNSFPSPRLECEVDEAVSDQAWLACGVDVSSFVNNTPPRTTSEVPSLPGDTTRFYNASLPHALDLPDYVLANEAINFQRHAPSNISSDSEASGAWLAGPLPDTSSARCRVPSISPPWPGYSPLSADERSGSDRDSWGSASVSFATLLERCTDLDRAADVLKERDNLQHMAVDELHRLASVFRAIDVLCELCASFIAEHPVPCPKESLDPALLALIIAVNFKVLEVCGMLVSIGINGVQKPHDQLLLKRIDFTLTQTKISVTTMKEREMTSPSVFQTALDQAARLHQQIVMRLDG
ncbi:hypothetical protein BDW66DRAFT_155834 [Aspergillus desertorum]